VQILADKTMNQLKEIKSVSGEFINITILVKLGIIDPSDVKVELYYGNIGKNNIIDNPIVEEMKLKERTDSDTFRYSASIRLFEGGEYGYTFRVIPYHPGLINKFETGLVRWVVQ